MSGGFDVTQFQLNWAVSPLLPEQKLLTLTDDDRYKLEVLPPIVDFRSEMTPVKAQGSIGACTAFAACAAFEYIMTRAHKLVEQDVLSESFVYYCTRVNILHEAPRADRGAHLSAVMEALQSFGACKEQHRPYGRNWFAQEPSEEQLIEGKLNKVTECARLFDVDKTDAAKRSLLKDIKTLLAFKIPVVCGFEAFDSVRNPDVTKNGIIPDPDGGARIGGHAIVLVGYNEVTKLFVFKNSWSVEWGDHGYGYLPFSFVLTDRAKDFWVVLSAVFGHSCSIKPANLQSPGLETSTSIQTTKNAWPMCHCVRDVPYTELTVQCECACCRQHRTVTLPLPINPSTYVCSCVLKLSFNPPMLMACECTCCRLFKGVKAEDLARVKPPFVVFADEASAPAKRFGPSTWRLLTDDQKRLVG